MASYQLVDKGEWKGWRQWVGSPFEDVSGPYYLQNDEHGPVYALRIEARHLNSYGKAHGGALAAFADSAIFAMSEEHGVDAGGVTVSLAIQYIGPVGLGDIVEVRPLSVRETKGTVFVSAEARVRGKNAVFGLTGIIKKPRSQV